MNRTNHDQIIRSFLDFLLVNRRLLTFLCLFLFGVFLGSMVFTSSGGALAAELAPMLDAEPFAGGFYGGISLLWSSCLAPFVLLALLFLTGLSACGAPVAVIVPVFFGMGTGMTEAYYYALGGNQMGFVALFVIPHSLMAAMALIMGCSEALRMSVLISRQMLPAASCGGLWQDFRLYCLRFLIALAIAFGSGVLDICLRAFFLKIFV